MAKKKTVPRPGANPNIPLPTKLEKRPISPSDDLPKKQKKPAPQNTSVSTSSSVSVSGSVEMSENENDSNIHNDNSSSSSEPETITKTRLPPPIFIRSDLWLNTAPLIFNNPNIKSDGITAKSTSDGKINIKTTNSTQFRSLQSLLLSEKIDFHTYTLAEDRQLKVVLRGIPTNISTERLQSELEALHFDVKLIRRFGTDSKPMPLCLAILSGSQAKDIFDITELFFLKISVESFRKTGPSQCHSCQRFGHGSSNCGFSPRCVKCAGPHKTSDCTKTRDQDPTCVNCGETHTANYRKCPYFLHNQSIATKKPADETAKPAPSQQAFPPLTKTTSAPSISTNQPLDYATATKGQKPISTDKIITLLTDLLSALTTADDPKSIMIATINSFLLLLKSQ